MSEASNHLRQGDDGADQEAAGMSKAARFLRWFAIWWSGKSLETIQTEWVFWACMTRSNVRTYCLVVFGNDGMARRFNNILGWIIPGTFWSWPEFRRCQVGNLTARLAVVTRERDEAMRVPTAKLDGVVLRQLAASEQRVKELEAKLGAIGEDHAISVLALRKGHQETLLSLQRQLAASEQRVALLQQTISDHVASYTILEQRQITTQQQTVEALAEIVRLNHRLHELIEEP